MRMRMRMQVKFFDYTEVLLWADKADVCWRMRMRMQVNFFDDTEVLLWADKPWVTYKVTPSVYVCPHTNMHVSS
jgi:hypothetical protein